MVSLSLSYNSRWEDCLKFEGQRGLHSKTQPQKNTNKRKGKNKRKNYKFMYVHKSVH